MNTCHTLFYIHIHLTWIGCLNWMRSLAYKHLPFLGRYSCRSYLDSCTNSPSHCFSFAFARRWAPRFATPSPIWSDAVSSDTFGQRRLANGPATSRSTVTACSTTCSFCGWHRSCPTGSSIWRRRWLAFRSTSSHWAPSVAWLRRPSSLFRRAKRCRRWAVQVKPSPGPRWVCWRCARALRYCRVCSRISSRRRRRRKTRTQMNRYGCCNSWNRFILPKSREKRKHPIHCVDLGCFSLIFIETCMYTYIYLIIIISLGFSLVLLNVSCISNCYFQKHKSIRNI